MPAAARRIFNARKVLLWAALFFSLIAMLYLMPHLNGQTADQVRLGEIERRLGSIDNLPSRTAVLEAQMSELIGWARGIGTAVGLAILERLMRVFGVSIAKKA